MSISPVCQSAVFDNQTSLPISPICQSVVFANQASLPISPIYQSVNFTNQLSLQTLFFNHQSLDLTLSDLCKSEPSASPDKPMGQLWSASSSVFEAQSLTNSGKSLGIVWKICPWEVPQANFSRQPLRTFHCFYQSSCIYAIQPFFCNQLYLLISSICQKVGFAN